MEVLRLLFVFRFPSLELPKQVRRVSLPSQKAETLSLLSSPSDLFKIFILKDLEYVNLFKPWLLFLLILITIFDRNSYGTVNRGDNEDTGCR